VHHAIKAYWRSGVIVPRIVDLGTRWRRVVRFTLRPLYSQGKRSWYPLDRRLGMLQSRSGRGGEEKNSQPLPELELPIIQFHSTKIWTKFVIIMTAIKFTSIISPYRMN
jgi:hypothetical protein